MTTSAATEKIPNSEIHDRMLRVRHESWELYAELIEQMSTNIMSEVAVEHGLALPNVVGVEPARTKKKFWDFIAVSITEKPGVETAHGDSLKCWLVVDGLWDRDGDKLVVNTHLEIDGLRRDRDGLTPQRYRLSSLQRDVFKPAEGE